MKPDLAFSLGESKIIQILGKQLINEIDKNLKLFLINFMQPKSIIIFFSDGTIFKQ